MEYLIDGNNLLHAAHPYGPGAPIGRERLCAVLGPWARQKAARITVVFDGAPPPPGLHEQMRAPGIGVEFSAPRSADEVIEERIAGADRPLELTIVTSDRAIQSVARARRCACVEAGVFAEQIFTRTQPTPTSSPPPVQPEKPREPSREDSDAWLRQFQYDPDEPPDDTDLLRY